MSTIDAPLTRTGTQYALHAAHIDLVDNASQSLSQLEGAYDSDHEGANSLAVVPTADLRSPRSHIVKQQLMKRKYAKHSEARYKNPLETTRPNVDIHEEEGGPNAREDSATQLIEQEDAEAIRKQGRIRRGGRKVKSVLRGRRYHQNVKDGDSEIDVLYENQRGSFVFGMPLFSSQSLLNFDPAPWTNSLGRLSSVNITNAQVPDPSWEWAWNTWYVDMSHDVDEQGWQYSFMFQKKFAWHGTHPWFHSFVRRRRWLRKRIRKDPELALGKYQAAPEQGKRLNANYFLISPRGEDQAQSELGERPGEQQPTDDLMDTLMSDIDDLPTLLRSLKYATVDREKINMVLTYMDKASADTQNFAEEIPHILSLFVYQNTRRQLLGRMTQKIDAASDHRAEHERRHEVEEVHEKERLDSLIQAAKAADAEVRKLEFWSDIREMVNNGESLGATDEAQGWEHGWEGVDRSGGTRPVHPVLEDESFAPG